MARIRDILRRMSALAGLLLLAASCGTPIVDARDGRSYPTVAIGGQCWMALNLDHGVVVPDARPRDASAVEKSCYGNDPGSCRTYGGLYTWDEARQACPVGWHLPSREEWETLAAHLGTATAGEKLKARKDHVPAFDGTDEVGFTALPAGTAFRGAFGRQGDWGVFWTVDRERPRAGRLGDARPAVAPGAAALPERGLRRGLPEGERVLGEVHVGDRPSCAISETWFRRASGQAGRGRPSPGPSPSQRRGLQERTYIAARVGPGAPQRAVRGVRGHLAAARQLRRSRGPDARSSTGSRARACGSPACSRARASARRAGPP